jgi:hypothetical protein
LGLSEALIAVPGFPSPFKEFVMNMYNLVRGGFNPAAFWVVKWLHADFNLIPRFRDAFVRWNSDKTEPELIIFTRTGGGNREDYEEGITYLRSLPGYLRDADDEFDATYALFYYQCPQAERETVVEGLRKLEAEGIDPSPTLRELTDAYVAKIRGEDDDKKK